MMHRENIGISIEGAKEEELEELVSLYLKSYVGLEEYSYTHPEDVKAYMGWLWRRDPEGIRVAKVDGKVVGFVAGDSGWFSKRAQKIVGAIHEIAVLPEYQGLGIGKALMERILEYFRNKGLDSVELWVGDENRRAMEFYEKLGFKRASQYNYWVRMVKDLGSKA